MPRRVSVGAIVGGGWSTGLSVDHMLSLVDELDRKGAVDFARWEVLGVGLTRLLLFKQLPDGLVRGRRFRQAIERGLPVQRFEDCEIPFRAIACTDDGHTQKIIFRQGLLLNAITASTCIPGIVFPIPDWNGRAHGYFDAREDESPVEQECWGRAVTASDSPEPGVDAGAEPEGGATIPDPYSGSHLRHELRTPVNHIIGYSELLLEEARDSQLEPFTGDLRRSTQRRRPYSGC